MKTGLIVAVSLGISLVCATVAPASATVLDPGSGEAFPDVFTTFSGTTLLACQSSGTVSTATYTYSATAEVLSDPSNTFCAGCLDFVYQVTDESGSTDAIARITAISFTGFETDVGFSTTTVGGLTLGSVAPSTVDRSSGGDTIGFNLSLLPGDTSNILVIETNATSYASGAMNTIDGSVSSASAFEPVSATPLPGALPLFAAGISVIGLLARRRKRNNAALAAA